MFLVVYTLKITPWYSHKVPRQDISDYLLHENVFYEEVTFVFNYDTKILLRKVSFASPHSLAQMLRVKTMSFEHTQSIKSDLSDNSFSRYIINLMLPQCPFIFKQREHLGNIICFFKLWLKAHGSTCTLYLIICTL